MQNDDRSDYKYVFVCGLHRSGTSMLGRNIARLENCTGFKNTGADMDEGQLLQDVYTIDTEFGGAGRFGFEPSTHRTETSELLTPENIATIESGLMMGETRDARARVAESMSSATAVFESG